MTITKKVIDEFIAANVLRIRKERNLTQTALGWMVGVDGSVIHQVERCETGLGKDLMSRLCNQLKIRPVEFFIEKNTPVVCDEVERIVLMQVRQAERLGMQTFNQEMIAYAQHRIDTQFALGQIDKKKTDAFKKKLKKLHNGKPK